MTQANQRLLALAILLGIIGLVWIAIIAPVAAAFAAQSDELDNLQRQLARYKTRIAMRPVLEMRLADLKRHEASSTGLVGGNSAELAAASVQNVVKSLIETDAGQVRSAQNLPPASTGGIQRIEIQYDASIPMTKLKDVAYRIETSTPYLFLDAIDLRAPENWQSPGMPADPPPLDVRWTVHAYRWMGPQ